MMDSIAAIARQANKKALTTRIWHAIVDVAST
jgi:hypothetical protein